MDFFLERKICFIISIIFLSSACNSNDQSDSITEKNEEKLNDRFVNESIYQLPSEWHTQNMDTINLTDLEGKFPVMAMIFTNCGYACPRMVADLQNIEDQLPKEIENEVIFVLASFDTERDSPKRLKEYTEEMDLDDNWLLLHGNDEDVRLLSMLLDVQYKKQQDGNFAHSNKITLLDKKGQIIEQIDGLGKNPEPIISKLKELHKK